MKHGFEVMIAYPSPASLLLMSIQARVPNVTIDINYIYSVGGSGTDHNISVPDDYLKRTSLAHMYASP